MNWTVSPTRSSWIKTGVNMKCNHHIESSFPSMPNPTSVYICMPCPLIRAVKESRHSLQLLILINLFVRLPIPPQLILPLAQDLADLERLRVHPPETLVINKVSLFVQFDRLGKHMSQLGVSSPSTHNSRRKSQSHFHVQIGVHPVLAAFAGTVVLVRLCEVG